MSPVLIGISALMSLPFLAFLALAMMRKVRNAHDDGSQPMQDGALQDTRARGKVSRRSASAKWLRAAAVPQL